MTFLQSRQFVIAAAMFGVVSLICTQFPLLNYLGYEFSAVVALLSSVVCGVVTIKIVKTGQAGLHPTRESFHRALTINLMLLIIPLVVMTTNGLFVRNCSWLSGMGFFVLTPVVTVWFVTCLGFFCAVHYRFPKTIYFVLFSASLLYVLALGYYTPALFSYNLFYGYFPGFTYDERLSLSWTMVAYRFFTVLIGGVLLWMTTILLANTNPSDSTKQKGLTLFNVLMGQRNRLVSLGIIVVIVATYIFKGPLGFESHSGFIQDKLGEQYHTEHFTIYYARESYGDDEIKSVAAEHEFRLQQISDLLSISFKERIESYVYPSAEVKQRLTGAGNTNVAKPWLNQVHITKQTLDGTLKHELIHVVVGRFGLPIIHASASTGLVEGLAMAIEWDWGNRTLHQYAAALRKFGVFPDIRELMRFTGFAAQSSSVSYVLAGSFCRYLIDRYGIRLMMQLYGSGNYEKLYGRSLDPLIKEWHNFLDRVPVGQHDADIVDASFRRPAIFRKVCARVIAERNSRARKDFQRREYALASQQYFDSYTDGKGDEALSGYLASELRLGHYMSLTAALDTIIMREEFPARYLATFLNIGDAFWGKGEYEKALELYSRASCVELGESYTEALLVRSYAIADSQHRQDLFRYFLSDAVDSIRLEMLDSLSGAKGWLVPYLKGRMLFRSKRFEESTKTLDVFQVPDTALESIRLKTIGKSLFRLMRFQEAKVSFWSSLNSVSTEVAVNEVNDWAERCDWMSAYFSDMHRASATPPKP